MNSHLQKNVPLCPWSQNRHMSIVFTKQSLQPELMFKKEVLLSHAGWQ